jgi:F-type H+-transporting ATPase subunit a
VELSPDALVVWQWGFVKLNATILVTWATMLVLVVGSRAVTRTLETGPDVPRLQSLLEIVVVGMRSHIGETTADDPDRYLPFVGTLFLFIATSTVLAVIPGVSAAAASLSTTAALALCVFLAIPVYGIAARGLRGYFGNYLRPTPFMLPFHLIGEVSRTVALAIRLFGNLMSGRLVVAILLSVTPILFPAVMEAFGLFIGLIQAYVFAILAMVYIASGVRAVDGSSGGDASRTQETTTWKDSS